MLSLYRSMRIFLLVLLSAFPSAEGALRYGIPDYAAMLRDADIVAVVRFVALKDTLNKRQLDGVNSRPSGLHFRELKGTARVVSLLKGDADAEVVCRLYRYPTLEESSKDLGDPELARKRLAALFRNSGLVHVFPGLPSETDDFEMTDFLVYLKKSPDGFYIPVTGDSDSDSSIRMLSRPSVAAKLTNRTDAENKKSEQDASSNR